MFKNLDSEVFGIVGRQNEAMEMALSFGFEGLTVEINEMITRAKTEGLDFATRYVRSARLPRPNTKVGTFNLPVRVDGSEANYKEDLEKLEKCCEIINAVKLLDEEENVVQIPVAEYVVAPATDGQTYQDNFELHRNRLGEVADALNKHGIKLAIGFNAEPAAREGKDSEFVFQAEAAITLVKTIARPNVGLQLDLWNWVVGDGGKDQINELTVDQIFSVKVADVPADADLSKISSSDRMLPGTSETSICVDVLKFLESIGYAGPVTPFPSLKQFQGTPREMMAQKTSEALDQCLAAAGIIELVVEEPEEGEEGAEGAEGESKEKATAAATS